MKSVQEMHQMAAAEFQRGNRGGAVDILEKILQDHPNNPWIVGEMGGVLIELNRKGVGCALLTLACSMQKEQGVEDWRHWSTLGSTLESLEQRDHARAAFDEAIRVDATVSDIWDQIAGTYVNDGQPELCIQAARKAMQLRPDNPIARKHLALGLLEAGEWAEAWPLMESRKDVKDYQRPIYNLPQWKGEAVDTLIVHGEQGIGDELFYSSLIARIRSRVHRLIIEVTPRLVPLMRRSFPTCEVYGSMDEVVANGGCPRDALPQPQGGPVSAMPHPTTFTGTVDLSHIVIGGEVTASPRPSIVSCASLPFILGLGRNDVRSPGFLVPDAARVDYWSERIRIEAAGRPVVGITWEGGVRQTHKKVRNPPFDMVRDFVAAHPEYCWVSVQYTHGQITNKSMPGTIHYQQAIDDLDEQAALISALDLMVSVPQTAVHIAGALNVPVIAVVTSKPRWDFCSATDDMPWWESVRMIKQAKSDDPAGAWRAVFEQLDGHLAKRFPKPKVINETQADSLAAE